MINRRSFLHDSVAACAAAAGLATSAKGQASDDTVTWQHLPRWRGFNLLEKFKVRNNASFRETDFAWMAELGFDFARFPLDYRCWIEGRDWMRIREDTLKEIDEGVAFGRKHGIHVCLNFHRAPGYTVAKPEEAHNLWIDPEAQRVCAYHWAHFAKRYQGIPNSDLSFNLFNEPATVGAAKHRKVVEGVVEAIRKEDEKRLVICDGRLWGKKPPKELLGLDVAAATRGYEPFTITHYQASWAGEWEGKPTPKYPLQEGKILWNKETLHKRYIEPWQKIEKKGMGVIVGEFGAFNKTPHAAVLPWMRDCLELWRDAGWGWAMWNFRGAFGIIDSGRTDVQYENWRGHKLDRPMLELLQSAGR